MRKKLKAIAKSLRKSRRPVQKPELRAVSESVDIDNFLIDQQAFLREQVEAITNRDQAAVAVADFRTSLKKEPAKKISLPGQLSISLNKQGQLAAFKEKHFFKNSAFTLNLKKTGAGDSQRLFNQPLPVDLAGPSLSLLKKTAVMTAVKDFFSRWNKFFDRIIYLPSVDKPLIPSGQTTGSVKFKETRLLNPLWFKLKNALFFALIALLFIVPFRGYFIYRQLTNAQVRVLGATETALTGLKQGLSEASADDWEKAGYSFTMADDYFGQATRVIGGYNQKILYFLENLPLAGQKVKGGKNLLAAGELLSQAAGKISQTMNLLKEQAAEKEGDDFLAVKQGLGEALVLLKQAMQVLEHLETGLLPRAYQESFAKIKEKLPQFIKSFDETAGLLDFSESVLGYQQSKRYLFVFQNNNELRPTGGFMGSYALVDLAQGKIINLEVPGGGFYDLKQDFQASAEKALSPKPMRLLGSPWMPWDANWWPDVPVSMDKLLWFYYKAGGPSVDGIFLVNSSVLPEILKNTGNIALPEYNELFTPDNVVLALQHKTEFEYDKAENKPKKVIGDLMAALVQRLMDVSGEQLLPTLLTFHQSLENKEIQLYFTDEELQDQARARNWTGEIRRADKDYLAVISTNIAGGKSNSALDQQIDHYAKINFDGSIVNTVALTLNHRGDKNDVFQRVQNNDYVRVYVPQGSKLLEASGYDVLDQLLFKEAYDGYQEDGDLLGMMKNVSLFGPDQAVDVYDELGKTVFGAWLTIKPGQSKTLTFSYQLPFKLNFEPGALSKVLSAIGFKKAQATDDYSLLVQKQSGAINTVFNSQVSFPATASAAWSQSNSPQQLNIINQKASWQTNLDKDYLYSILLKK